MEVKKLKKQKMILESRRLMFISLWRRRLLFWGGGILVGIICVLFAYLCDELGKKFLSYSNNNPYMPLLITPIGFVMIIYIMKKFFPGSEGSGIPQVMAALQVKNFKKRKMFVSIRIAVGKFFLTACGFMVGASIGREGPTIQLSASLMHGLGKLDNFHRDDVEKGLLLAGGGAGIAAAFNAPLAGIVFAIEELAGSYDKGISGTIIATVVLCGFVALEILGNYTYFGTSNATLNILADGWYIIIIVAIIGGFLGGLFSFMLVFISEKLMPLISRNALLVAFVFGLLVAIIGVCMSGQTYGSGYEVARKLLTGEEALSVSPFFGIMKMLATLFTYLSGIPGGIFAPSLAAGAGFGASLSHIFNPEVTQAVILLGTVAYFTGVVQSPITCFIIVSEMTNNATSSMLLPIMLTAIIANAVSKSVCRQPLYHTLCHRFLKKVRT